MRYAAARADGDLRAASRARVVVALSAARDVQRVPDDARRLLWGTSTPDEWDRVVGFGGGGARAVGCMPWMLMFHNHLGVASDIHPPPHGRVFCADMGTAGRPARWRRRWRTGRTDVPRRAQIRYDVRL